MRIRTRSRYYPWVHHASGTPSQVKMVDKAHRRAQCGLIVPCLWYKELVPWSLLPVSELSFLFDGSFALAPFNDYESQLATINHYWPLRFILCSWFPTRPSPLPWSTLVLPGFWQFVLIDSLSQCWLQKGMIFAARWNPAREIGASFLHPWRLLLLG